MNDGNPHYPRTLATAVEVALRDTPVVCLLGPRQCGKTTLARALSGPLEFFSLDDAALAYTARHDPDGFVASLPGSAVLDEIQRVPELLPAIKTAVDRDRRPGRFLLTGSANLLLLPTVSESLAGRMETLYLHPLAESEKTRSPGRFLADFLAGGFAPLIAPADPVALADLPRCLVAGGFPEPLIRTPERARQWHRQYIRSLLERDIRDVARIRETAAVARLMELLALRTAELANVSALSNDLDLRRETVEHYLAVLDRLFLIRSLPAWHRNEAKRLIKSPKIHVVDSGLAAALCGLMVDDWLPRRDRFGHLLESFVVQQIVAQAGWTDPDLRFWHYRDRDQVEVDLVITRGRSTWGIEVKASASVELRDGAGLCRLAEQAGGDFVRGVVLYSGASVIPLGDPRICAVPLNRLWTL